MKWVGHVAHMGEKVNSYRVWWLDFKERNHFKMYRCKHNNNIKMDHQGIKWRDVDRIILPLDRNKWQAVVNTVMNVWVT
jgi:hypothetical protein